MYIFSKNPKISNISLARTSQANTPWHCCFLLHCCRPMEISNNIIQRWTAPISITPREGFIKTRRSIRLPYKNYSSALGNSEASSFEWANSMCMMTWFLESLEPIPNILEMTKRCPNLHLQLCTKSPLRTELTTDSHTSWKASLQ